VVEEVWRNLSVEGWMSFVLKEKLKVLKSKIKLWNKVEYGGMEDRIEKLVEDIKRLDEKGEEEGLCDVEVNARKNKFEEVLRLLKAKDSSLVQRS
jgi:hypothetical protein